MPFCLDIRSWRIATRKEVFEFHSGKLKRAKPSGSLLVVREKLTQIDMYSYLRARFGIPNGFQNFLRKDDSDNLVHWDFNLKAAEVDIYIQGRMRDVLILISKPMNDENWKLLILGLKTDFARIGKEKSEITKSFEKFVVFQNKFCTLAGLCADLHASIVDAPPPVKSLPKLTSKRSLLRLKSITKKISERARNLYGDCLKLKLLTPIMAEAFLNMVILTFCKPEIRNDKKKYDAFVRANIPQRLEMLATHCVGLEGGVDPSSDAYKQFPRVMNARNFAIHGNVDPVRESIEIVYFEGKRPIFAENGDHILKLFEHLELINAPEDTVRDYEMVHLFLLDICSLLSQPFRDFFAHVIDDPYPGYEVKDKRVTKILPSHNAAAWFPKERLDTDLRVEW